MTDDMPTPGGLEHGRQVIESFARSLPHAPGVYRMVNKNGEYLYIGKAKALQKRVISYTQIDKLPLRLKRMVSETTTMEATHTNTEAEALLLEANMIRRHLPRYNIQLRDDKSVPYIFISTNHDFPLLTALRGPKNENGTYYGPFASAKPVWDTIHALQRVFRLRNCTDYMFATRKRPCLQYHIKRCTAPCVGKVTRDQYMDQVDGAREFLEGRSADLQKTYADKMQAASSAMDYETAAQYRDKIRALSTIQSKQDINPESVVDDVDIIGAYMDGGVCCIQVFFFRGGRNYGNKAYFPRHASDVELPEILSSFIGQFYQSRPCAPTLLLSHDIDDSAILAEALTTENDRSVTIAVPQRGDKKRLVDFAVDNAKRAHERNMADSTRHRDNLEKLADLVGLPSAPERVEVYDNSHLSGTNALGVMVVVGPDGFEKKQYRKFNIRGPIESGDDYAMLREVLTRRLSRDADETGQDTQWPDLLVIDGGKGQLGATLDVLRDLNITLPVIAISKGPDRNAGREWIHFTDRDAVQLPPNDPLLYFLQRIRDEAHRFAITGQRARRAKTMIKSKLDSVPGIGAKRKKALLLHFGSAQAVERAGIDDLMRVDGISRAIAEKIYGFFNGR